MCVIVYKPSDVDVDMDVLKQCWKKNSDGAGLMFAEDGELHVKKGFMRWRSMKRFIKRMGKERFKSLPVVLHFRIATHGSVRPENTHPFGVTEDVYMAHNGVLSCVDVPKDEDISDTETFILDVLHPLHEDLVAGITTETLDGVGVINKMLGKFIGGNKLVFMDSNGDVAIVNEHQGSWGQVSGYKDVWFSNMLWKPYKSSTITYGKNYKYNRNQIKNKATYGYGGAAGNPITNAFDKDKCAVSIDCSETKKVLRSDKDKNTKEYISYYCVDCHGYFERGESRLIKWDMGYKEIVRCPNCDSDSTVEADKLFDKEGQSKKIVKTESQGWGFLEKEADWSDQGMMCFDCASYFHEDDGVVDTREVVSCGGTEKAVLCPFCQSKRTYIQDHWEIVQEYGLLYFGEQDA